MSQSHSTVSSIHDARYRRLITALVRLREAANLSQSELGRQIDLTQSTISKIERYERRLDALELLRWLEAIGATDIASHLDNLGEA